MDGHGAYAPLPTLQTTHSLRRDVLAVLHRQDDARAVVEAVAILFGEVVDALAGRDLLLGDQRLTDRLTEFRRARLRRLQRHRDHPLEHLEGVVGMPGELAAGIYYYVAEIDFFVLDPEKQKKVIKEWVHLIR